MKTVAVAMSGGVDSSAVALILKNQGYKVIGITGFMHNTPNALIAIKDATKVCVELNIEHHIIDLQDEFKTKIIQYFENDYKNARTPNPCTHCNNYIKWGALKEASYNLGADCYATGHYAQIKEVNNRYSIHKAIDEKKDQSYMLFGLSQDDLKNTIFPLHSYSKDEIRQILIAANISVAKNKDSQDVCFINPPDTTKKYLTRTFKEKEGVFVNITTGEIVGKHTGFYQYTIGQRRGIGIAASEPLYVVKLDSVQNVVYVGFKEALANNKLTMGKVNWQQENTNKEFEAMVKYRYNTPATLATVKPLNNGEIDVLFNENQDGIAPGQVCVVYDLNNKYIICGGWIKS